MCAEEKKDRQGETEGWGSLQQVEIPFPCLSSLSQQLASVNGQTIFFLRVVSATLQLRPNHLHVTGPLKHCVKHFLQKVWVMEKFHLPTLSNINGLNYFFPLWELLERPKRDKNLAMQLTMDKKWNPTDKKTTPVN